MFRLLLFFLVPSLVIAQQAPVLSDFQTRIGGCIYEIGQRSQQDATWVCVTFSPVSAGAEPSLWDSATSCQAVRPTGNHALWGNHIVLWPISCDPGSVPLGSATLTWTAPTQNVDGSPLMDLAGYRVYLELSPTTIESAVPNLTIDNLSSGSWTFKVTAVDGVGNESVFSNSAGKVIQ